MIASDGQVCICSRADEGEAECQYGVLVERRHLVMSVRNLLETVDGDEDGLCMATPRLAPAPVALTRRTSTAPA